MGFTAPRFLAPSSEGRSHALSSPLALLRLGRTLTAPLAPQGFCCRKRSRSLSRPADLPAVLHLITILDALETSQSWAMGSPQRLNRVTTERFLIFALLSGPRPELAEKHIIGDGSERLTSRFPLRRFSAVRAGHDPSLSRASSHRVCLPHRVFSSDGAVTSIGLT